MDDLYILSTIYYRIHGLLDFLHKPTRKFNIEGAREQCKRDFDLG
jgi:hypothetical protein